jgi:Domain of unknown function (DUF222)
MTALLEWTDSASALARSHVEVDALLARDLTGDSDDALLESWRELERLRRRLAAVEHAFVLEAEARGLPHSSGCRNTATFLRGLLRLDPAEAAGRLRAAEAAGPRRSMTGESLAPAYPVVAAAQASGALSERQARVIVTTVETLPEPIRAEHRDTVEAELVEHAGDFTAEQLAKLARRITDHLDPDGILRDAEFRHRERALHVHLRPDGSASGRFEADAEGAERLLTVFDTLARPRPQTDGVKDPRTAAQRRYDALIQCLELAQRAELLPQVAGVSATIIVTMDAQSYLSGKGLARTGHGALVAAGDALSWSGGDARVLAVVLDSVRTVTAYSSRHRIFTESQRLAMNARDQGCTFPGCTVPANWSQAHHVTDYAQGGTTTVDNGALACGYDHRERIRQGWTTTMINRVPHWIPPPWIDPRRQPVRNTTFDV